MAIQRKRKAVRNGIAYTGKGWSYVLRVPDPKTGKTKPKWVGSFTSEQDAKLARDKARVALASNTYVPSDKVTLEDFLKKWFEIHRHSIKSTTANGYADSSHSGSWKFEASRPSTKSHSRVLHETTDNAYDNLQATFKPDCSPSRRSSTKSLEVRRRY
jgi:hypothetical protein